MHREDNLRRRCDAPAQAKRREFIARVGAAAGVSALAGGAAGLLYDSGGLSPTRPDGRRQVRDYGVVAGPGPELVVARSTTDPAELVRRAIAGLGGMHRFVSPGDVVVIKPNIGWDRLPAHAANTNPEVVAELVRLVVAASAKRVVVTDASCNDARRSFLRSGIWRAAHACGADVVIPAAHRFREMRLRGDILDQWPVYVPLVEADKVINVPVAKHHNLSRYTGAMKNWYGLLGGRRNRLHQNIDVSIADLATFMRPTLTVLDATRVLLRNGPQGGNLDDAKEMHQVVAGLDQVAVDGYGCRLIGEVPTRVGYLQLARERALGTPDYTRLNWIEV